MQVRLGKAASCSVIMYPEKVQGGSNTERKEEEKGYLEVVNHLCCNGSILLSSNCLEVHMTQLKPVRQEKMSSKGFREIFLLSKRDLVYSLGFCYVGCEC